MNVRHIFASAVIRKVAYILVAFVVYGLFSLLGMHQARAGGVGTDRGHAYAECLQAAADAKKNSMAGSVARCSAGTLAAGQCNQTAACYFAEIKGPPPATLYDFAGGPFDYSTQCTVRPNLTSGYVEGGTGSSTCSDGCTFVPTGDNVTIQLGTGANQFTVVSNWHATTAVCNKDTIPGPKQNEQCIQTNPNLNQCIKPDGSHCIYLSNGSTKACWQPGEVGLQPSGNEYLGKSTGQTLTPPNTPPTDGSTWAPPSSTDSVTVTTGGTGVLYPVGGGSSTGNTGNPGGGNHGGNGAPGGGTGTGTGTGTGNCGEAGQQACTGAVGEGLGDSLYTPSDATVATVFAAFQTRAGAAPILNAPANFLTYSGGAACPVFRVEATDYWDTLIFDAHCNGPLADVLALGGYLVLAIAAFAAFKIAMY